MRFFRRSIIILWNVGLIVGLGLFILWMLYWARSYWRQDQFVLTHKGRSTESIFCAQSNAGETGFFWETCALKLLPDELLRLIVVAAPPDSQPRKGQYIE